MILYIDNCFNNFQCSNNNWIISIIRKLHITAYYYQTPRDYM